MQTGTIKESGMLFTLISVLLFYFAQTVYADCRGCCSWHGGVCCSGGTTVCCDGTPLSSKCKAKGCNVCSSETTPEEVVRTEIIRLYGIDCPELDQNFGYEAMSFTKSLVLGKDVIVKKKDTDMYGRIVGLVYLPDGTLLNEELVKNGYAWVYDLYCTDSICSRWKQLEQEAREKGRGLWQDPNPIPPWEYRQQSVFITDTSVSSELRGYVTYVYDGDTVEIQVTSTSSKSNKGGCTSISFPLVYVVLIFVLLLSRARGREKK